MVRRASGGGAIVHDQELTYSLTLPWDRSKRAGITDLVQRVHRSLVACLAAQGVADCRIQGPLEATSRDQPFLCFQRRAEGDVLLGDHKIIGSAQRRLGNAILQHGSVLLNRSAAAPELPGIGQLASCDELDVEQFAADWPDFLSREFDWNFQRETLAAEVCKRAKQIEMECFGRDAWTRKR